MPPKTLWMTCSLMRRTRAQVRRSSWFCGCGKGGQCELLVFGTRRLLGTALAQSGLAHRVKHV